MYGITGTSGGGIVVEGPEGMDLYRLLTLESRLKMEASGLRFSPSGRTLARDLYGITGSRGRVLEQVRALREKRYPLAPHEHTWGPVEHARMTGNPHRRCTGEGCDFITLDLSDEDEGGPE